MICNRKGTQIIFELPNSQKTSRSIWGKGVMKSHNFQSDLMHAPRQKWYVTPLFFCSLPAYLLRRASSHSHQKRRTRFFCVSRSSQEVSACIKKNQGIFFSTLPRRSYIWHSRTFLLPFSSVAFAVNLEICFWVTNDNASPRILLFAVLVL